MKYKHFYTMDIAFESDDEKPSKEQITNQAIGRAKRIRDEKLHAMHFKTFIIHVSTTENASEEEKIITECIKEGAGATDTSSGEIARDIIEQLDDSGYGIAKKSTLSRMINRPGKVTIPKVEHKKSHSVATFDPPLECIKCGTTAKDAGVKLFRNKENKRFLLCNEHRKTADYGYLSAVPLKEE